MLDAVKKIGGIHVYHQMINFDTKHVCIWLLTIHDNGRVGIGERDGEEVCGCDRVINWYFSSG